MKTDITAKEYKNIYEVCDWNPKAFSLVLKKLGYSDELVVKGDLWLENTPIKSLVNVKEVKGYLDLSNSQITSLGNLQKVEGYLDFRGTSIQSLGNLEYVGLSLYLTYTPIRSLGNLKFVRGSLYSRGTPISKKYSEEEIRQMVTVGVDIYL